MTLQFTHQPTTIGRPAGVPRHLRRWLVPAGLAVTLAAAFVVVDTVRDGSEDAITRSPAAADVITSDYTRSQRLIDDAIDQAITAATVSTTDYTRSQRLIDDAIDQAITDTAADR